MASESFGDIFKDVLKEAAPDLIHAAVGSLPMLWDAAKMIGIGNLLGLVPDIVKLISTISQDAHDRTQQNIGATAAAAAAMTAAHAAVTDAISARQAAEAKAAADPTDTAFDPDFKRSGE